MRSFRIDSVFTFCDNGESVERRVFCSEANLDVWTFAHEDSMNVFRDDYVTGRRGSMTSFSVVEIDPQPEVKGVVTSNRGIL